MIKFCPNCNEKIVYSYNIERDSYYLRCKRDYECWHMSCDKETAVQYTKLTTASERLLNNIMDSIDNGDDDYYNGYDF